MFVITTLGQRLVLIRKSQIPKLSQTEFAKAIGMGRSAYSMYEINKVSPPPAILKLIELKYGVNPRWLEDDNAPETEPMYTKDKALSLEEEIRAAVRGQDPFVVSTFAALARMDQKWWDAWHDALMDEMKKGTK